MSRCFAFGIAILVLAAPLVAQAQGSRLVGVEDFRRHGLERMWFTNIDLDRSRGRMAGLHQHVSSTQTQTVYEILHEGRRYVFSQRDRNAFGEQIGPEGAKQKAEEKRAQITGELIARGKPETDAPKIEMHVVPETTLYATSERGMVHAIDAETGRTRWSTSIGSSRHPTTAAGASDKYVAALNGSTLYVLKSDDGSLVWSRVVSGAPGAGPALTDELVFVPMLGGAVQTFELENHRQPPGVYKSFGRAMVQPVATLNSVAWPTDRGNLYVSYANEQAMRFRMEANDEISAAPSFLAPDKVFTASLDGYVYCLNEAKGNIVWRFTTGDSISSTPVGQGDAVYVITEKGSMYSIGAADGVERWMTTGIQSFLAGNDQRIYCTDLAGNITIVDVQSGSQLGTIAVGTLDLKYLNTQTDRIIVGTKTGMLQCFRESRLYWPVVHAALEPQKKQAAKPSAKPAPAGEAMPAAPVVDPFAPAGAVDPFAPAKPAPAPAPTVDPFAPAGAADPFAPAKPAPAPAAAPDPFAP